MDSRFQHFASSSPFLRQLITRAVPIRDFFVLLRLIFSPFRRLFVIPRFISALPNSFPDSFRSRFTSILPRHRFVVLSSNLVLR